MKQPKKSIFREIMLRNLLLTMIPLVIIISFICILLCSNFRKTQVNILENYLSETANNYRFQIDENIQRSEYILKNNDIIFNLNQTFTSQADIMDFLHRTTAYMDNIATSDSATDSIIIYTSNESIYENKYISNIQRLTNADVVFQQFQDQKTSLVWDEQIYTDNSGNPYLFYYRNMPLNPNTLMRVRINLFDPATDSTAQLGITSLIEKSRLSQLGRNDFVRDINAKFAVVSTLNTKQIYTQYLLYILLFLLIIATVVLTLFYLASRTTMNITTNMRQFVRRLEKSDLLSAKLPEIDNSQDTEELQIIKTAIHSLINTTQEVLNEKYKVELEKQQLSLNLLQSKINPHLLYNSLSVIKLKAFKEGDDETLENINALVRYYRLILSKGKEFVTLAEEIDLIRSFVKINEIAQCSDYHLNIKMAPDLIENRIVHILLQPLVENAIIHGLAGKQQNPQLLILAESDGEYLLIKIQDNGYGMSLDKVDMLNSHSTESGGYGIHNTIERIKLYYGDECGIHFESKLGQGTTATVKIRREC